MALRPLASLALVLGVLLPAAATVTGDEPPPVAAPSPQTAPPAAAPAATSAPSAAAPAGGETPTPAAPAPEAEPETVVVTPGPFAVIVELAGAFEPAEPVEIAWKPESLGGEVEVVEAAPAGMVEAGQVLVSLKAPRQSEQVGLARMDVEIASAHVARLQEDDKRREQAQALQRASEQRDAERTAADLKRFLEVERALRLTEADHNMKGAENGLQDAIEELAQLEKMYKADDLTEETEDIVLKRSQRELARQKERLAYQKQRHAWVSEIWLPRDQENLEHAALAARQELERFEATAALVAAKGRAEVRKAAQELELQKQNLARLESDLAALTLRAPKAGRIVPGTLVKGRWQGVEETARLLKPGEKVRANQVLFTLFECGDLRVRTQVAEAQFFQLREGAQGTVTPTADEDLKLPVTLRWISPAAVDGKHEALFSLDAGDPRLLPGLTGKLKLRTRERADALTVPEAAVSREGEQARVHVWADGAASPRDVKLGPASEGRFEVREGLVAGEKVLAKAPAKP